MVCPTMQTDFLISLYCFHCSSDLHGGIVSHYESRGDEEGSRAERDGFIRHPSTGSSSYDPSFSVHRQTSRGHSSQNSSGISNISFLRMRVIKNVVRIAGTRKILDSGYFDSYLCENLFIYSLAKKWKHKFFAKRIRIFFQLFC